MNNDCNGDNCQYICVGDIDVYTAKKTKESVTGQVISICQSNNYQQDNQKSSVSFRPLNKCCISHCTKCRVEVSVFGFIRLKIS